MLSSVPLPLLEPFRRGVVSFPRGSFRRNACVAILKLAAKRRLAGQVAEIRPLDAPDLSFIACDSMVLDAVYWFGIHGYEGGLVDLWAALCRDARSVLEIGGNIGFYTVIGGRSTAGRYTVVEPIPEVMARLRENLARNGADRVETIAAAAVPGEMPRRVTLNVPDEGRDCPVGAHLVSGVEGIRRSTLRVVETDGVPVAQLAAGRDVIKIDAEGIEHELLGDIRPLLRERAPTLVVEVLPESTRLAELIRDLATEIGYRISVIPAWGTSAILEVPPAAFTASTPQVHNSKDVILSRSPLPAIS